MKKSNALQTHDGSKKKVIGLLINLIFAFSITTLFQSSISAVPVNKIVGGLIFIVLVILFSIKPKRDFFICTFFLLFDALFSVLMTEELYKELNDWILFFSTIFLISIISNDRDIEYFMSLLREKLRAIKLISVIECSIIFLLLITGKGYAHQWGEGTFFVGFCNSQHTMAALCCLISSMILFLVRSGDVCDKKYILLISIPAYAILQTGARVFLFPLVAMLWWYIRYNLSNKLYRNLVYVISLGIGIIAILKSNMVNKFTFVMLGNNTNDILSAFTSGRIDFWKENFLFYLSGNLFELLFGTSFSEVYKINLQTVHLDIWAHNDFVHLINGGGLIGVSLYAYILCSVINRIKKYINNKVLYMIILMYMFLPMVLNGFFTYQHFVYSFMFFYLTIVSTKSFKN